MEIKITHGLSQSPFFIIVQPKKTYDFDRTGKEVTIVTLTHPVTKEETKAELHAVWTMDDTDFMRMNALPIF